MCYSHPMVTKDGHEFSLLQIRGRKITGDLRTSLPQCLEHFYIRTISSRSPLHFLGRVSPDGEIHKGWVSSNLSHCRDKKCGHGFQSSSLHICAYICGADPGLLSLGQDLPAHHSFHGGRDICRICSLDCANDQSSSQGMSSVNIMEDST